MRILLILLFAVSALANGGPPITTVVLVRHAEKAGPSGDVQLSDIGVARANELARVLTSVKFDAIYTTPFHRTRNTAAPVAEKGGVKPVEITAGATYAAEMAKIVREKHTGGTVLIVGHSNTTRDVIKALGGDIPEIVDSQYDDLFIVTLVDGAAVKVLPLRYGAVQR
jgi:2,3-bisphosphoglycerate-dependent phosphoglycerate mutase